MIINVPDGTSHIIDKNGQSYMSKIVEDRLVIDVPPDVFRTLLAGGRGHEWHNANANNDRAWLMLTPGAYS